MGKAIYTKAMGFGHFLVAVLSVFKEPRAAAASVGMATAVAGGGTLIAGQVDAKHNEAMIEIQKNKTAVTEMVIAQKEILVKLDGIKDGVTETKDQVKDLSNKVWQIGRDVYILKQGK